MPDLGGLKVRNWIVIGEIISGFQFVVHPCFLFSALQFTVYSMWQNPTKSRRVTAVSTNRRQPWSNTYYEKITQWWWTLAHTAARVHLWSFSLPESGFWRRNLLTNAGSPRDRTRWWVSDSAWAYFLCINATERHLNIFISFSELFH